MKRYSLILCLVLILSLSGTASAQILLGPPPAAMAGGFYTFVSTTSFSSTVYTNYGLYGFPAVGGNAFTTMGYYVLYGLGAALEFDLQGGTTTLPTASMTVNNFAARLGGLTVNTSYPGATGTMVVGLYDMADTTEDGVINFGDFAALLGSPGSPTIATRTHNFSGAPANFNNIDVTAALQNDLFGGGPINFSGFILMPTSLNAQFKGVGYDTNTPTLTIYPPGVKPPGGGGGGGGGCFIANAAR